MKYRHYDNPVNLWVCSNNALNGGIRERMYKLIILRWYMEEDHLIIRTVRRNNIRPIPSSFEFQRARRIHAAEKSKTWAYVVADDDCMPNTTNLITVKCLGILHDHPDFAILSMMPTNAIIRRWRPEGNYEVFEDDSVIEHHSVGGIRFCRAGIPKEWPPMEPGFPGYDRIHCEQIRKEGWRVGYYKNVCMVHLGEGYSQIWRSDGTANIDPDADKKQG